MGLIMRVLLYQMAALLLYNFVLVFLYRIIEKDGRDFKPL